MGIFLVRKFPKKRFAFYCCILAADGTRAYDLLTRVGIDLPINPPLCSTTTLRSSQRASISLVLPRCESICRAYARRISAEVSSSGYRPRSRRVTLARAKFKSRESRGERERERNEISSLARARGLSRSVYCTELRRGVAYWISRVAALCT